MAGFEEHEGFLDPFHGGAALVGGRGFTQSPQLAKPRRLRDLLTRPYATAANFSFDFEITVTLPSASG